MYLCPFGSRNLSQNNLAIRYNRVWRYTHTERGRMAERRMFSKTIVDSDTFLDMPLSTQALYFHLSMRADDDGFINNPRKIQRVIGATEDDLKLLVAKSFIIPFESGVVVIKHWKIHNYIQNDRYKETVYLDERRKLSVKENKEYTLDLSNMDTECIQNGYTMETQVRIGKDSIGKNNISNTEVFDCSSFQEEPQKYTLQKYVDLWNTLEEYGISKCRRIPVDSKSVPMLKKRLKEYGEESFAEIVEQIKNSDFLQGKICSKNKNPFNLTFGWAIKPNNYKNILEGKYRNSKTNFKTGMDNIKI